MSKHEWAFVVAGSAFMVGVMFRLGWLFTNWVTGKADATFIQHIGRYVIQRHED